MDGASNNPQDGLAPDPSGAATPHDPNPAAAGHAPPFLDIFVADPRDQTAKNCAATALLPMFPNPWLETEYTHARARLVEIYPELQARAEDFRNCALDMKGRVAGEPVLALADVIVRTRFVEAPGSEVRRALCKALVEMLAYDAGVTETSAFVEVARAFRLEMERLQEDPATADRPPETWGAWDLINWFDGEEGHNGSRAVIAWKKLKGTLQAALSTPQPPPAVGTIDWEDEAQPDLPQPMDLDDTGSLEAPTFFWGLPPPEGSPAYVRTEGAEARIGAALSTHSPLSAFTRGSTRDLAEEAIRTEVQRLLKSFDRATETKDRARMERALMRLLSISTGTHHNALVGLKWAEDSLAVDDMKYPGVLSRDARMLWRPELDPRGVDHPARGALPIPLADQLSRRLIVLAPEPGKRVFRHIDPDHRDREGEGVRPSIGALALALSARLMRREPWGMSLAQQVTGDFRGIDRAPLFYDEIDLASAAIEVARITFAWYGEKPGRMPALPIGIMGSRRVPPIAPVRACLQSIRNGYASAAGNFAEQLRHRTRNCMHGYALQGGFRVNERIESITRRNIGSDDPIAMVCDKVVAANWAVRPIVLSKKWQQEYRVLLGELAYACEEFEGTALGEAAAAALAGSGPVFLDIVDEDNVRPFGISAYREGVPAELDGLDNFARQLLNNRLTRRLPEPLRVAQMGWHGTREGAWAEGSPWSVSSAARLISPKLDEILMEVGWRALPSSRVARPIPDMPPLCWTKAWREHDRQFRGLVEMAKSALEERNSKTSQELLATLGSCIGHLHPGLKMDAHGKIELNRPGIPGGSNS